MYQPYECVCLVSTQYFDAGCCNRRQCSNCQKFTRHSHWLSLSLIQAVIISLRLFAMSTLCSLSQSNVRCDSVVVCCCRSLVCCEHVCGRPQETTEITIFRLLNGRTLYNQNNSIIITTAYGAPLSYTNRPNSQFAVYFGTSILFSFLPRRQRRRRPIALQCILRALIGNDFHCQFCFDNKR